MTLTTSAAVMVEAHRAMAQRYRLLGEMVSARTWEWRAAELEARIEREAQIEDDTT